MYRLFYDYPCNGDVLFIVIEPKEYPDSVIKNGNVAVLKKDGKTIGINIFDLSEVVKIHSSGMIATPDDALIDVINSILSQAGAETLTYCRDSGYKVAKVVKLEEHPLDSKASIVTLSLGDHDIETTSRYQNLSIGQLLVVALDGTIKFDGSKFLAGKIKNIDHDADICSSSELKIDSDSTKAFSPDGSYKPGDDFYLGGSQA